MTREETLITFSLVRHYRRRSVIVTSYLLLYYLLSYRKPKQVILTSQISCYLIYLNGSFNGGKKYLRSRVIIVVLAVKHYRKGEIDGGVFVVE